jgi:uncharacterized membrane protein
MTPDPAVRRSSLPAPLTVLLGFVLVALLGLIELDVLEYTYSRLGVGHRQFTALLLASLLGSVVNVRLGSLAARDHAGTPGTPIVLAVNLGGAVIPALLSLYLLYLHRLFGVGAIAIAVVAGVSHALARPVPGKGIAMPVFVPPVVAAVTALLLAPDAAPALAYASGSLGTLLGADVANLYRIRELGAPVVSIGGAGTFDGIFLTGILAVLLA